MGEVPIAGYLELNNHPDVKRLMPLASQEMTASECREWVQAKEAQWQQNGYGPWAIYVNGQFAGWGGLQRHNQDADLGLVLHPKFWGIGPSVARQMIGYAFRTLDVPSIIILFPPERTRTRGVERMGFVRDGEEDIDGHSFIRFRLARSEYASRFGLPEEPATRFEAR